MYDAFYIILQKSEKDYWELPSDKARTCLAYIVNIIGVDESVKQVSRASTDAIITLLTQIMGI